MTDPHNDFDAIITRIWDAALRGGCDVADLIVAARALYPAESGRRRKFTDQQMLATLVSAPTLKDAAAELGCSRQAVNKRLRTLWTQRLSR